MGNAHAQRHIKSQISLLTFSLIFCFLIPNVRVVNSESDFFTQIKIPLTIEGSYDANSKGDPFLRN